MKKVALLVLLLFILSALQIAAQDSKPKAKSEKMTKDDKRLYETADNFYKQGNYVRALAIYRVLADTYTGNADLLYKTGLCFLYKADEKENSIEYMINAGKINPKLEDYDFNLGRAYHANYKFEDAIQSFETYLQKNPPIIKKNLTEHYIEFCKNGEVALNNKSGLIIENIGPPVNSEFDEYVPVLSGDESVLIFTYKGPKSTGGLMDANFQHDPEGEYYEDIFISYKVGEKWTEPQSIGENINTKGHDASIALSSDGQKLFIFKSTPQDKGDIYMSTLEGEVWNKPVKLNSNVNTPAWEGSVSMSADEQTLYFASERPGGLGGRDIYMSKREPNGDWGTAVNLGPTINTKYDDDAPYIHPDGRTLFFSSKGHNSLGGYDIFHSIMKNGDWTEPENMGAPVNTTEDDIYYVLTPDGETGYYSSNRKEGYGRQDIYVITPGLKGEKPVLALAIGLVTLDSKPTEATIKLMDADNGEVKGIYRSNSSTGKYMVTLPPGTNYKICVEVPGNKTHCELIDLRKLDNYVQMQQDIPIYSEQYAKEHNITESENNLQKSLDAGIKEYKLEAQPEVYEARMYKDLMKKYGDVKKDSVTYNVNLGTYETPSDFNAAEVADMGKVETMKNSNGTTTYYVSGFNTMVDAESFRQKLITRDTSFNQATQVTVNDKGQEKLMPQYFSAYYSRKDYTAPTEARVIKTKPNPELAEKMETEQFVSAYGDKQLTGLTYKVELAAVDKPAELTLPNLSKYGKLDAKKLADGKTHYSIGNFKTLKEANDFKQTLASKEPLTSKSKIEAVYQNNQKTLKEFFSDPVVTEKMNKSSNPTIASTQTTKTTTAKVTTQPTAAVAKATTKPATTQNTTTTSMSKENLSPCDSGKTYSFSALIGKSLNDPAVYAQLMSMAGSMCAEGLTFKVQVGAYRHPENYTHSNLKSLSYSVAQNGSIGDGITRFTMGEFKTMKDCENLRQKAIQLGTKDAWITAVYNGKRMTLEELIVVNFYNKAVN